MGGKLVIALSRPAGEPRVDVIRVEGFLDAATSRELSQRAGPLVAGERPLVVIDLGGLEYLGSAGVAAFMDLAYTCQDHHGEVALAKAPVKVLDVLKMLGLEQVLTVHNTPEEAVAALRGGAVSAVSLSRTEAEASRYGSKKVEFVRDEGATEGADAGVRNESSPVLETQPAPVAAPLGDERRAPENPSSPNDRELVREIAEMQLALTSQMAVLLEQNAQHLDSLRGMVEKLRAILSRVGGQ